MNSKTFNPINYGFTWTADWYDWDSKKAHQDARRERDVEVKALRKSGRQVRVFSRPGCLMSRGGIGSGHPHIEQIVTAYGYSVIS